MLTKFSSWLKLTLIVLLIAIPVVTRLRKTKQTLVTPVPDMAKLPTILPTVTVSPTSGPAVSIPPSPTASATATPTPEVVPENPYSLEEIHGFLKKYSDKYGIDINYLRHVAVCESGFNTLALNNIYAGLFQFDPATWTTYRELTNEDPDEDLRFNAYESIKTASYLISIGKQSLWPNCIPE